MTVHPDYRLVHNGRDVVLARLVDGAVLNIRPDGELHRSTLPPDASTDLETEIQRFRSDWTIESATHLPGQYHPRVWRGAGSPRAHGPASGEEKEAGLVRTWIDAGVAVLPLFEELRQILTVVQPDQCNDGAFGHRLRQLLILACTEVEAAWRGILEANNRPPQGAHYTTNDYVALHEPLRLREWTVLLDAYPDYPAISPFGPWDPDAASRSLGWYAAYNAVKHDREAALDQATLRNLIRAMAGLHVMICAQFGPRALIPFNPPVTAAFRIVGAPEWAPEELCFRLVSDPSTPGSWEPVPLF